MNNSESAAEPLTRDPSPSLPLSLQVRRAVDLLLAGRPPLEGENPVEVDLLESLIDPKNATASVNPEHIVALSSLRKEISVLCREQDTLDTWIQQLRQQNLIHGTSIWLEGRELQHLYEGQWVAVHAAQGVAMTPRTPGSLWIGSTRHGDALQKPFQVLHYQDGAYSELTTALLRGKDDEPYWTPGGVGISDFFGS